MENDFEELMKSILEHSSDYLESEDVDSEDWETNGKIDDLDDLDNIITLNDENGNDVYFEFLDLIEYRGNEYVILLPVEENDGEVVILKVDDDSEDGSTENYSSVDDEDALQAVFEIFKDKFKDEFNFDD